MPDPDAYRDHDQLVAEARRLIGRRVPALDGAAEAFRVVDRNGLDAQRVFAFFRERRPQAAQHLRQNGRAVVAGGHAAVVIRHDKEHRNAVRIRGRGAVQRVKAAEHHLERRLHCQRARFQIEHAVQNAGLPRLQKRLRQRLVHGTAKLAAAIRRRSSRRVIYPRVLLCVALEMPSARALPSSA